MTVSSMIRKAHTQDIQDICTLLEQVLEVHHAGRPDIFRAHGKKYDEKAFCKKVVHFCYGNYPGIIPMELVETLKKIQEA